MALPLGLKPGLKALTVVQGDGFKDEYAATCLAHAVVYRKNGKAIKTAEVDDAIKEQLNAIMSVGVTPDTSNLPDVMQTEQELANAASQPLPTDIQFESTPVGANPIAEAAKTLEEAGDEFGFDGVAPEVDLSAELEAAEARSVDNVNLREIAVALYQRFGVYTVYINKTPAREDINPLTGAMMNTLTLGQANQGFRIAQRTGTSWNPTAIRSEVEAARNSRKPSGSLPTSSLRENQVVGEVYGEAVETKTTIDDRRYNRSYESPHSSAMYNERGKDNDGTDPDEVYAEPPINSRNAIVRPFKSNQRSELMLERISQRDVQTRPTANFDDLV